MLCNVCGHKEAEGVFASKIAPTSNAYCKDCIEKGAEPYDVLVTHIAYLMTQQPDYKMSSTLQFIKTATLAITEIPEHQFKTDLIKRKYELTESNLSRKEGSNMVEAYKYQCDCGWSSTYTTGKVKRNSHPNELLTKQLEKTMHPKAMKVWKELQIHPLMVKDQQVTVSEIPAFLRSRMNKEETGTLSVNYQYKICTCSYCKTIDRYLVFSSKDTNERLHELRCERCGEDVTLFNDFRMIDCPACSQPVHVEKQVLRNKHLHD